MSKKENITDQYKNPIWEKSVIEDAHEVASDAIVKLEFDEEKVPSWLKESFITVALNAMEKTMKASERIAIDGVLPKRYKEFEEAHSNDDRPYSVITLLMTEYFATGRIANGVTREDIQYYDPDLMSELRYHEGVYGELPSELYIPKDQSEVAANAKIASGYRFVKR